MSAPYEYAPEKAGRHEFVVPNGNRVVFIADSYGQVTMSIEYLEFLLVRVLGWHKTSPIVNEHLDKDFFY